MGMAPQDNTSLLQDLIPPDSSKILEINLMFLMSRNYATMWSFFLIFTTTVKVSVSYQVFFLVHVVIFLSSP